MLQGSLHTLNPAYSKSSYIDIASSCILLLVAWARGSGSRKHCACASKRFISV